MRAQKVTENYLQITAPFDGVVTDRLVHPGALVGPGADPVLLVIQQISHLQADRRRARGGCRRHRTGRQSASSKSPRFPSGPTQARSRASPTRST